MAHDALRTILPLAGLPAERAQTVAIGGGAGAADPSLAATPVETRAANRIAANQIESLRRARPISALLSIGRGAARDLAAVDPVLIGLARHRPSRVHVECGLVAPFLDQKHAAIVALR